MRKWLLVLSLGLLLLLSAVLPSYSSSATQSPEARERAINREIQHLLVQGPFGWTLIRDVKRLLALEHEKARLHPPHEKGWNCIHSREGSWADDGAPYWGGLQMSYNWMRSLGGINGQANWYSPLTQMWAAERVSRRYNFAYSWMKGQWPNTYPPCAGYF